MQHGGGGKRGGEVQRAAGENAVVFGEALELFAGGVGVELADAAAALFRGLLGKKFVVKSHTGAEGSAVF